MKMLCVCLLGFLLILMPWATYAATPRKPVQNAAVMQSELNGLAQLAQLAAQHPELANEAGSGCTTMCDPASSNIVLGAYLPMTAKTMAPLVKLAEQDASLLSQRAGDCRTSCEWDPIAQENVCHTHCDSDNSGPVSSGGPPPEPISKWGADQWLTAIVLVCVIGLVLWYLTAVSNAETASGPPA